jgi:hypothetical protein
LADPPAIEGGMSTVPERPTTGLQPVMLRDFWI